MTEMVAPWVDCPGCDGMGFRNKWIGPTSDPRVICDVVSHDCPYCGGEGRVPQDEASLIA